MGAGIVVPWVFLMGWTAYHQAIVKDSSGNFVSASLPEPYHFMYGTLAMGMCGVVAQANSRVGTMMAVGLALGAVIFYYMNSNNGQAGEPTGIAGRSSGNVTIQ